METRLEVIKSLIGDSIEEARQSIDSWNKYILNTQKELSEIEKIASSIDEMESCPICGGQMVNVGKIIKRRPLIRYSYGGEHLDTYLGMTNTRIIPTGYECQKCGIFQKEPNIELKHEWTPGTNNRFAISVFSSYPSIQKVAMGHFESFASYLFLIDDQWYTFGELSKDEVIERLSLANPQRPVPKIITERIPEKGFVYLIKAPTGHYKIGRTKDISARVSFFVIKLPFEIELIHHFEADDMRKAEAELHEKYKAQRANGEWFTLTDEDIAFIQSIK